MNSPPGRLALALAGALLARATAHATVQAAVRAAVRGGSSPLRGTNFRGREVSLAGGPALGLAASLTAAAGAGRGLAGPVLVAGLGATAAGHYDDVVGGRPGQRGVKGLRGHLRALRRGRLTAGTVKAVGLAAAGLGAAALLPAPTGGPGGRPGGRAGRPGRAVDVLLAGGLIAGTANLVNLLDLRPGRALKAGLLLALPLVAGPAGGVATGPAGAAAGLLPADLDERIMIGDSGANGLGAVLGVALATGGSRARRTAVLALVCALTLASERVSFSHVIESIPWLRRIDRLGRGSDVPDVISQGVAR